MVDARTYYEILGVAPDAAPEGIRAAYIGLMKRHHPNSPYRSAAADDGGAVHSINRAYAVLKDPGKRSAYDVELNGGGRGSMMLKADRRMPLVLRTKRRQRRQRRASMLPIAAIVVALFAASTWLGGYEGPTYAPLAGTFSEHPRASISPFEVSPPHETAWIRRQAQLAATMRPAEALAFSEQCFNEARHVGTPSAADECLVFDLAFTYWREGEASSALPAYFQPQMMQLRQTRALDGLDRDAATLRMDSLRAATFSSLLELVNTPEALSVERPADTAPPGQAEVGANLLADTEPAILGDPAP